MRFVYKNSWISFHPKHRADLSKSGITCKQAVSAGLYSMRPCDIQRFIKLKDLNKLRSVLVFPYLLEGDFCRYKLFWEDGFNGIRYYQKPNIGVKLYLTSLFVESCRSGGSNLYITEGEKKAIKLSMQGYPACAIGGVWNFTGSVLDRLSSLGVRKLFYIPDDDVWRRDDLKKSVIRFNNVLQSIRCDLVLLKNKEM